MHLKLSPERPSISGGSRAVIDASRKSTWCHADRREKYSLSLEIIGTTQSRRRRFWGVAIRHDTTVRHTPAPVSRMVTTLCSSGRFFILVCRNFDPLTLLLYFKIYLKISSQWSLSWCFNKNRIDTLVYDKNDPFNYTEMMRLSRNHPATFLHSYSAQHETIRQSEVGKFNSTKVAWVSIQSTKIIHSMTTRWSTLSRNSFLNLPLLTWALGTLSCYAGRSFPVPCTVQIWRCLHGSWWQVCKIIRPVVDIPS